MSFEFLLEAVPYIGAVAGQIGHMVKKKVELKKNAGADDEEIDEIEIVKHMIVKKPINTIAAVAASLAAVTQLVVPEASAVHQFITAFVTAFAADSLINRPGK